MPLKFQEIGLSRAIRGHKKLETAYTKGIVKAVKRTTLMATAEIRRLASGPIIKVRSGRYRASVRHRFEKAGTVGYSGPNVEYAAQIEHGGVIVPRTKRWLTIPLRGAKTAAGVAKKARDYTNTFFYRTPDGRLFLMGDRTPGGDDFAPLFRLVKRVDQKPKKVLHTARENIAPEAAEDFRRSVHATLREAIG